jgi:glucose-1-phosphate thymidylyltransferase
VHIDDDVLIVNSCVGPYTSIGRGSKIKECEMDNCIILEGAELENVTKRISKSLIGKKRVN